MDHIKKSPKHQESPPTAKMRLVEPNEINRLSPWEVDFRQLEAGAMETQVSTRSGASMSLLDISMSHVVHQTGVSPRGMLTVGITQPNQVKTWQGSDSSAAELLSFGSAIPFDGVSATGFRATAISVSETFAENVADSLGLPIPGTLRISTSPTIRGSRGHLTSLRRKCSTIFGADAPILGFGDEEEVTALMLLCASNGSEFMDKSSPKTRTRALALAIELMREREREDLSIGAICREAGVSLRTLNRAFNEKFGCGPKSYYLSLRLNCVRSAILKSPKDRSIADVAHNWDFWHMGQFSCDYFKLFGELPSATKNGPRQI
jgi:AraC family ethanolamine operon transcriptional activator